MARTIAEIQSSIIAAKNAQAELAVYNSPSAASLFNLFTYVVAACAWTLETLFDLHAFEVQADLANQKAHRPAWYADKAKNFQFGSTTLIPDQDYYDNTGLTDADVEAAKVVKYAAAKEVRKGLRMQAVTIVDGDLAPLPEDQFAAWSAYMERVKDAGVRLYKESPAADSLKLSLKIYYDALVLDAAGKRLDGTNDTPVQSAVNSFLKSQETLPFNGLFVPSKLVNELQKIDGVIIPHIVSCQAKYGALPYQDASIEYLPDGGYLRFADPADLTLEFIAHEPI
jgi:hypothetical protein